MPPFHNFSLIQEISFFDTLLVQGCIIINCGSYPQHHFNPLLMKMIDDILRMWKFLIIPLEIVVLG